MSYNIEIKTDKEKISGYINKFEKGQLQVPAFQRDFVWENDDKIQLFDSIKKNYPIGSILLWQPEDDDEISFLKSNFPEELGAYQIPISNNIFHFILDGYQRLSTLIGCLLHPTKAKEKGLIRNEDKWFKEFNFVYNLKDEQFEFYRGKSFDNLKIYQIPIYKLVDAKEFFQFQRTLFNDKNEEVDLYLSRYEEISLIFQNYEIPNINLYGGSISEAIDIFQRLNSKGSPITTDWIISASLVNQDNSFRLGTEISLLLEELKYYNYEKLKRDTIINCILNSFGSIYFDQISKRNTIKLEQLVKRSDFIEKTKETFEAIRCTVKFFFEDLCVVDSQLIPYTNQFIFINEFFRIEKNPSFEQKNQLKLWFWKTSYTNYFTIYNLTKQREAFRIFQNFIEDIKLDPFYYDGSNFETQAFPDKLSMSSVRSKTLLLFMLNNSIGEDILDNKLDAEKVTNYTSFKILKTGNATPENTVILLENDLINYHLPSKVKSLDLVTSLVRFSDQPLVQNLFLTKGFLIDLIFGDSVFIKKRKEAIMDKEALFVKKLEITYNFDDRY